MIMIFILHWLSFNSEALFLVKDKIFFDQQQSIQQVWAHPTGPWATDCEPFHEDK
jgi:hypothetical protein